ncbi:MAG: hypothetical protein H6R15_557 [Proteobacteria bacterium]|nr:hypothetical protein [Pseudomonadota bacterium]
MPASELQPGSGKPSPPWSPGDERPASFFQRLYFLFCPSPDFADQKFRDHRQLTIIVSAILALLWPALWGWDVVTDPLGAANTITLRLLFLLTFGLTLGFVFGERCRRSLAFAGLLGGLAMEANFVEILNRLEGGMVYGLAGFMYCMFLAVLVFQCFSLALNIGYTVLAAALPHALSWLGLAHDFPHLQYAVLIWPAAALAILTQVALAYHYLLRYQLQRQLELLSNTDPLSGASNRRFFMPQLGREMVRARRMKQKLALLMLDIDHFKRVNDSYGHPTGDLVICRVTDVCRQVSRQIDVVARLGGEEFAVLLPGSDLSQAVGVAERIRKLIEVGEVQSLDHGSFRFTVSIGVAELGPGDAVEIDLLARADAALYRAKESGRNRVLPASAGAGAERAGQNLAAI